MTLLIWEIYGIKEKEIMTEDKILFPFQYIEAYFLGEIDFDVACNSTMEECYRLIEEYIEEHKEDK